MDADVRPGPLRTDHVLAIGNAATTLTDATIRTPVRTALDLGTGCDVWIVQREVSDPGRAAHGRPPS